MTEAKLAVPFADYSVQLIGEESPRIISAQGCHYNATQSTFMFVVEDADGDMCAYCILNANRVESIIDPRFTKEATIAALTEAQKDDK